MTLRHLTFVILKNTSHKEKRPADTTGEITDSGDAKRDGKVTHALETIDRLQSTNAQDGALSGMRFDDGWVATRPSMAHLFLKTPCARTPEMVAA